MRTKFLIFSIATAAMLSGCGEQRLDDEVTRAYDRQAASLEQRADQLEVQAKQLTDRADILKDQAADLDEQAKQIRDTGQKLSAQVRDGTITEAQAMPAGANASSGAASDGRSAQ